MRCPECVRAGEKSCVYVGTSMTTLMYCPPFYDEQGRFHSHDMNSTSTAYQCSRGHMWSDSSKPSCWCGWPGNKDAPSGALTITGLDSVKEIQ